MLGRGDVDAIAIVGLGILRGPHGRGDMGNLAGSPDVVDSNCYVECRYIAWLGDLAVALPMPGTSVFGCARRIFISRAEGRSAS